VNRIARSCSVTVLLAGLLRADDARTQASEEIVIADELQLRTAFYEHAPRALATAMSKAVVAWCSSEGGAPEAHAVSWICRSANLVYFRNVYINGERGPHGLVCGGHDAPTFKYLGMDLVAESIAHGSCVPVDSYNGSQYELSLEGVGGGDA
jgi:hypothetical protein